MSILSRHPGPSLCLMVSTSMGPGTDQPRRNTGKGSGQHDPRASRHTTAPIQKSQELQRRVSQSRWSLQVVSMYFCHRQAPQNVSKKGEGLHASEQSNLTRDRQGFRATRDGAAWGEAVRCTQPGNCSHTHMLGNQGRKDYPWFGWKKQPSPGHWCGGRVMRALPSHERSAKFSSITWWYRRL